MSDDEDNDVSYIIDPSPIPVDAERLIVYSIDPGTVNMVVCKLSAYVDIRDKSRYFGIYMDWSEIINIKYNSKEDDEKKINPRSDTQIIKGLFDEFENGKLMKIHDEFTAHSIKFPKDKLTIIIEKQMDGIKGNKVPINYAIEKAIYMWALCRFPADKLKYFEVGGSNKSGLRGIHEDERKKATISVACHSLRREGFLDQADYIESLVRPKPAQDVADAYNQGRCWLLKWLEAYGCTLPQEIKDLELFTKKSIQIVGEASELAITETKKRKRKSKNEDHDKPKKKRKIQREIGPSPETLDLWHIQTENLLKNIYGKTTQKKSSSKSHGDLRKKIRNQEKKEEEEELPKKKGKGKKNEGTSKSKKRKSKE